MPSSSSAPGLDSFKGLGLCARRHYDRIQVRQDTDRFTFRDTDYLNLYHLEPADTPAYQESAIFIVRSAISIPPGRGTEPAGQ